MAISFIGSATVAYNSGGATFTFASDMSPAPSMLQGDLVVVAYAAGTATDVSQASMIPSGYTAAHTDLYANNTNDCNLQVSYKVMGSTPDTTISIPGMFDSWAAIVYILRGVDSTTPLDVTPATWTDASGTSGANADCPSITPVNAGAWIMGIGAGATGNSANNYNGNPSNMTGTTGYYRATWQSNGSKGVVIGGSLYSGWTSGAFDPNAYAGSATANNCTAAAVTLAFMPGGVATPAAPFSFSWF